MLILGREEPEVAGIDSDIAEPAAAFVSEVEVMQYIFVATTDTFAVHSGQFALGTLTTIEPMTMQAARTATRPQLAKDRRASG
jgi:hypothetical protein